LNICLIQEINRFNVLITKVRESLINLGKAIVGENVMSQELDDMNNAMMLNKVPANWEKVGFLSLKPLSKWFDDFVKRTDFF
jgi:dynein heavy chain